MSLTLFDFNHHVLPGDVLLLRSTGLRALANRAGQHAMRLFQSPNKAEFTHVALVVSPSDIADATPGAGVRIRSWRECATTYDLDYCKVARHPDLLNLAHDPARLFARVQFYYAQPYLLTSLTNRTVRDGKGIVCSQFVALVLHDLGLPALVPTAMFALPSDIDHCTRDKDSWRQFPFSTYGWHESVVPPPMQDPYWSVLYSSYRSILSTESIDRPIQTEQHSFDKTAAVNTPHVSDSGNSEIAITKSLSDLSREIGESLIQISEAMGSRIASMMAVMEAVCRTDAILDRQVLAFSERLSGEHFAKQNGIGRLPETALIKDEAGRLDLDCLSGQSLLDRWYAQFIEMPEAVPVVLSEADAPQRLVRRRLLLGKQIQQLTNLAAKRNFQAHAFQECWNQFVEYFNQGHHVTEDLLTQMHQVGKGIMHGMAWLETESADDITSRVTRYLSLAKETVPDQLSKLGHEAGLQAFDQIEALMALDQQRLKWVLESLPLLEAQTNGLESLLSSTESVKNEGLH